MKFKFNPSFLHLFIVLLAIVLALIPLFPLRVIPASATPDKFSAERAYAHLLIIAREEHPAGSPAQAVVSNYLVEQLSDLDLEVEVQDATGMQNVVARLHGTDPDGAILLQAHYDSREGPGAADNGSGVAAILEVMRALAAGPALRNDIIVLFDDSEELPDAFTGTKTFIRKHPWMADVRLAIGLDTAVRGPISVVDTGSSNGWMVKVLAKAYTGGAWTSLSGGGEYDTQPFKNKGIQVLELEDNYPLYQKHTPEDTPEIVSLGSLQQLGNQTLSVVREVGNLSLENTSGAQRSFVYLPLTIGLLHYPQSWAIPLAILAGILVVIALVLALRQKLVTWRALGVASLATLAVAGLVALGVGAIWKAAPGWFGWQINLWPEWPEVIPPNGWLLLILTNLLVLVLMVVVYRLSRKWSNLAGFSLFGLFATFLLSMAVALADPRGAIVSTWPAIIGAACWVLAALLSKNGKKWPVNVFALVAAIPVIFYLLPLVPGVFMGDGTKSVALTSAAWVVMLAIILPGVDGLFARPWFKRKSSNEVTVSAN